MTLVHSRPVVLARAYAGRWIADCPVCSSAAVQPTNRPTWNCQDCGTRLEVRWPSDDMRQGVERLLSQRPIAHTRNWFPGETLHDLLAENVQHGIGPSAPGEMVAIIGDRIERDTLPAADRRAQIGA